MSVFPTYSGFCDLNIACNEHFTQMCYKLIELNYRVVAVNQTFSDSVFTYVQKKQKGAKDPVPHPFEINVPVCVKTKLQILNRLTIEVSDPSNLQRIAQSENFNKYHLISLIPHTEAVVQHACSSKLVDMMTFETSGLIPFLWTRKLYNMAVNQNIYFEVPYAMSIGASKPRSSVIFAAHRFHAVGKSKNIVVTSAAENVFQLRGPYDIIPLGFILGLNEEQSKNAVTHTCKNLLLRAEGRRFGRTVMTLRICDTKEHNSEDEEENDTVNIPKPKRHCTDTRMISVNINR